MVVKERMETLGDELIGEEKGKGGNLKLGRKEIGILRRIEIAVGYERR